MDMIFLEIFLLFGISTCPWIYSERLDNAEFVWHTLWYTLLLIHLFSKFVRFSSEYDQETTFELKDESEIGHRFLIYDLLLKFFVK